MAIGQFVVDEDGMSVVLVLEAALHVGDLGLGHLQARPAIPLEAGGLGEPAQAGDESAGRHGKGVVPIFRSLDGDGEPVGQEQQATGRCRILLEKSGHVGRRRHGNGNGNGNG